MAYSGDPTSSPLDAIRFWAQDTGASPLLNDAEIDYLTDFAGVDPEENPIDAAALVADRIAAKYVGDVNINADGVSYSGDQLQSRYSALAKELRRQAGRSSGRESVPYVGGLQDGRQFGIRMHDNPQAGSQQYYGEEWPVDPELDAGRVGR
jgi:hypothetical protein